MLYTCCIHLREPVQSSFSVSFFHRAALVSPVRAPMDCHGPRLAFGLLDQDGCPEDDPPIVDVPGAASGDELCTVTTAGQEALHRLKARIAETLRLPDSDQILLPPNGRRAGAKRRIRSALPSVGRSCRMADAGARFPRDRP